MKRLDIENLAKIIKEWLAEDETRTIVKCAELSGVSLMTVKGILYYRPGRRKPNPSLKTIDAILATAGKVAVISDNENRVQ